jgi:hypothetical protein
MPQQHLYGLRRQAKRDAALAERRAGECISISLSQGKAASRFACRRSPKRPRQPLCVGAGILRFRVVSAWRDR